MAVIMTGDVTLPAERARVWTALNDPDVLRACIPGCHSLDRTGDTTFTAIAKVKISLISATFKVNINLSDIDPLNGYHIAAEGEGGLAGFAKGGAAISLADTQEGGTRLAYDVQADVGGKIAQLGGRWVDGLAKKSADKFFARFAAAIAV